MKNETDQNYKKKIDWNAGIVLAIVGAAALLLGAVLTPVISHWLETKKQAITMRPVETNVIDQLEAISKKAEYEISSSSEAQHKSLEEMFLKANEELRAHYAALDKNKRKDSNPDLLYLMGPAGAGKSTLLKWFAKNNACLVDLKNEFEKGKLSKYSVAKNDLQSGGMIFNTMPGLRDQVTFSLPQIVKDEGCCTAKSCKKIVIFDGLDELHPELAKYLLDVIENGLRNKTRNLLPSRVLVAGRPEGFSYFLKDKTTVPYGTQLEFRLPKYSSKGELNILLNELNKIRNRPTDQNDRDTFASLINKNSWLSYTITYLAYARFLNEYMRLGETAGRPALKEVLFDNMLENNHESNGRPQTNEMIYVNLLEEIAARYAETAASHDGYFEVNFADEISVYSSDEPRTKLGTFNTREILNRSGIAFLVPADFKSARYRFQPQWLHGYLVERWNKRIAPK